jgi:hypothetical protein
MIRDFLVAKFHHMETKEKGAAIVFNWKIGPKTSYFEQIVFEIVMSIMGFQKIFYFFPRLVAKFVDDWSIHLLHKIGKKI